MTGAELDTIIRRRFPNADRIGNDIVAACHNVGLHISYACALLEKESGFRNVFGNDSVRNPVKGGRVTRIRYKVYKFWRKRGYGMQGVGYTQLTWYAFQDQADKLGGCYKPYPNLVVGFRQLKELISQQGEESGAARYNGFGPAATQYGKDFVAKQAAWHKVLA